MYTGTYEGNKVVAKVFNKALDEKGDKASYTTEWNALKSIHHENVMSVMYTKKNKLSNINILKMFNTTEYKLFFTLISKHKYEELDKFLNNLEICLSDKLKKNTIIAIFDLKH